MERLDAFTEDLSLLVSQRDQLSSTGWIGQFDSSRIEWPLDNAIGKSSVVRHEERLLLASLGVATISTTLTTSAFNTYSRCRLVLVAIHAIDAW